MHVGWQKQMVRYSAWPNRRIVHDCSRGVQTVAFSGVICWYPTPSSSWSHGEEIGNAFPCPTSRLCVCCRSRDYVIPFNMTAVAATTTETALSSSIFGSSRSNYEGANVTNVEAATRCIRTLAQTCRCSCWSPTPTTTSCSFRMQFPLWRFAPHAHYIIVHPPSSSYITLHHLSSSVSSVDALALAVGVGIDAPHAGASHEVRVMISHLNSVW